MILDRDSEVRFMKFKPWLYGLPPDIFPLDKSFELACLYVINVTK